MSKYSIQRLKTSVIIANGQTSGNSAVGFETNGILRGIAVSAPQMTEATYTIAIKDGNSFGHTLFTSGNLNKNAVSSVFLFDANNPLEIPLTGLSTLSVTSAGAEGAARTFQVELLIVRE